MRLGWVVYGDLGQPTGGYVYDRLVARGLRVRGDEVEVVEPRGWDPSRSRFDAVVGDALCVRELGSAFERLDRATARVLLVHHLTSWELEHAGSHAVRALEARAIAASDLLVVTGRATAARLRSEYPGRDVRVVVPGADRLPRPPRTLYRGAPIELLFVGSVIARKRLALLLDAIERASEPRPTLTLVGDAGREPEHARAIAARIAGSPALRARVDAIGVVDDDTLAQAMARADLLVLPSSVEGYGMALTEALHAGLPVLASREAALAAGIADSGAALVFADRQGLVDALHRFAADASLRAAMREAARSTTLPRWNDTVAAFRLVMREAGERAAARERPT